MSNDIIFENSTSTLAVAAFRRIGPLRLLLEGKCFKIVGLQAAKNRFVDFRSIHANGISISLLSKTLISFFVMGLSAHDSNTFLFFVVSGFAAANDDKVDSLKATTDDDDYVDTVDVEIPNLQ